MPQYVYKSSPFSHQRDYFELSAEKECFAALMEQGTGKTKPTIDTAAYLYECGRIELLLVAAPNGVHRKWLLEDVPLSLPDRIKFQAAVWQSGNARAARQYEALKEHGKHLRIFLINVEALSTKKGVELVNDLLQMYNTMFVIDESSRIKNHDSKRTENIVQLGGEAQFRRILNGLPVSKSPFDLFSQFQFLDPQILGPSYHAFRNTYANWLPAGHPLVQNIANQVNAGRVAKGLAASKRIPQVIATDAHGRPIYKNLDKLKAKIEKHSFRVTKEECFDLPPKIYQVRTFKMASEQRRMYDELESKYRTVFEDDLVIIQHKLTLKLRLHQVACGFLPIDGEEQPLFSDEAKNPRMHCYIEELDEYDGQTNVWLRFKREVRLLTAMLNERAGRTVALTYYGDTELDGGDKQAHKEAYIRGDVQYLVGTTASGGIGHNYANASKAVFGSNTFNYDDRAQAEDRNHRYGLADDVTHVLYVDIEAEDSVDQDITASNKMKMDLGDYMMNKKVSSGYGAWLWQ